MSADEVRVALARGGQAVEIRETHISWVFLAGDRAYKLKKPIVLPFLDYGTPRLRHELCREEVRLNRRLAPDIYLGVRSIVSEDGGVALAGEEDPRALDYVVEMRRYDEQDTLAARLARGQLQRDQITDTGAVLAAFHSTARQVPVDAHPVLTVERRLAANSHELLALLDQRGEVARVLALERFAHAFVTANAAMLDTRARGGLVREGHGDLRAEHVLLEGDRVSAVDCVEFDRALRQLDVADDLAFLVCDLAAIGGERFIPALLDAYRESGGEPGSDALVSFYATYRALVRAKVALVRAAQHRVGSAARGHESATARNLLLLAERFAWRARLPLAIVVCGVPASGKSVLATALANASGLAHLSSDVTRKRLIGVGATERAPTDAYTTAANAMTYAELGRRAANEVHRTGGVIVDATFRHRVDRDAFRDAFAAAAPLVFVECLAPAAELERRARRREVDSSRVSDATTAVVIRERTSFETLDEVAAADHIALRSDRA
ncbi:MAG TPA: AAA family ATPase, partial [Solirubrobacteraceae bacterium]